MTYNSSDLTSILNTLSALSNPASQNQIPSAPNNNAHAQQEPDDDAYEPPDTVPVPQPVAAPAAPPGPAPAPITTPHAQLHPQSHIQQPQPNTHKPSPKPTESTTITTWPPALRHVMRTVSQNEDLQRRIRRLMHSQHEHEKQWWEGREALCRKQRVRGEKKRELNEVLRSVGAPVDSKEVSTAEENKTELQTYDAKIYAASRQMAQALTLELRGLGIPFFSLRRDLVASSDDSDSKDISQGRGDRQEERHGHGENGEKQMLTREELAVLQRRILELLVDLCKE